MVGLVSELQKQAAPSGSSDSKKSEGQVLGESLPAKKKGEKRKRVDSHASRAILQQEACSSTSRKSDANVTSDAIKTAEISRKKKGRNSMAQSQGSTSPSNTMRRKKAVELEQSEPSVSSALSNTTTQRNLPGKSSSFRFRSLPISFHR